MSIPAEMLTPMIDAFCDRQDIFYEQLSLMMGLDRGTIRKAISRGEFSFGMAERVICKVGDPIHFWRQPEMLPYYYEGAELPPDMATPVKCARETCSNWFALDSEAGESGRMSRRRFCSESCQNIDASWRRGDNQPRHLRCRNGHDREKVGVYVYTKGDKTYRRCVACHKQSRRRSYVNNEIPRRVAA